MHKVEYLTSLVLPSQVHNEEICFKRWTPIYVFFYTSAEVPCAKVDHFGVVAFVGHRWSCQQLNQVVTDGGWHKRLHSSSTPVDAYVSQSSTKHFSI